MVQIQMSPHLFLLLETFYYRMITVNQGDKSYIINLFSVSSAHKSYLCQSQGVRDIIEQYIEDNLIK